MDNCSWQMRLIQPGRRSEPRMKFIMKFTFCCFGFDAMLFVYKVYCIVINTPHCSGHNLYFNFPAVKVMMMSSCHLASTCGRSMKSAGRHLQWLLKAWKWMLPLEPWDLMLQKIHRHRQTQDRQVGCCCWSHGTRCCRRYIGTGPASDQIHRRMTRCCLASV